MILHLIPDLETARCRFWRNELRDLVTGHPWAFARIVKRQRKALGWSQEYLGEMVGISHQYVSHIEVGEMKVGLGTVRALMDALALTLADLRAEIAAMHDEQECAA